MIHNIKSLSDASLAYAARDLLATIEIQERTVRLDRHASCPKLGTYHDDLCDVRTEQTARAVKAARVARRPARAVEVAA